MRHRGAEKEIIKRGDAEGAETNFTAVLALRQPQAR
jgi:hypothetical protein